MTPLAYEFLYNPKVGALALSFNTRFKFSPDKNLDQLLIEIRDEKLDLIISSATGEIFCCEDIPKEFADMIRSDGNLLVVQFTSPKEIPASKVCFLRS